MAPPKAKERALDRDVSSARDPEAHDAALNQQIAGSTGAAPTEGKATGAAAKVASLTMIVAAAAQDAAARGDDQRDPEARDAALTDQIASSEGVDPATTELQEAAVGPVGLAPVDLVATPPSTGAAPAPGGPLPGRWVLTDAEIRPIVLGVCLAMFVSALNQTIIATALPTIGRDFNDFEYCPG